MGFLSPYQGTERIEMGGEYWVEVKKFLTRDEADLAREVLVAGRDDDGNIVLDAPGRLFEQVLSSIVAWNLTDEHDVLLPYDHDRELERTSKLPSPRRRSLKLLPDVAYDKIANVVGGNNNIDPEQERTFRTGTPSPDEGPQNEPSAAPEVHSGAEVVDDAGDTRRSDTDRGETVDRGGAVLPGDPGDAEPAEEDDVYTPAAPGGETVGV